MSEEIKEILYLQNYIDKYKSDKKAIIKGNRLTTPAMLDYLEVKALLNYITSLQQKVEQLENIKKEAIEYMKEFTFEPLLINEDRKLIMFNENLKNFENILNKGSENDVKKDNTNSN